MNEITMKLNADHLIRMALQEDITSEDITTNAVMPEARKGEVQLICKQVSLPDLGFLPERLNCWMNLFRLISNVKMGMK